MEDYNPSSCLVTITTGKFRPIHLIVDLNGGLVTDTATDSEITQALQ